MEPETTTEPATQDPGVVTTQPEEQPATAEQTPEPEPTLTTEPEQPAEEPVSTDNSDDDVTAWAANKGIDLSTPEGQAKALKSMRESEKLMHQKAAAESELRKQIEQSPAGTDDERVQRLETLYSVTQWKADKQITSEQDVKMGEYLNANPLRKSMVMQGLLSLDDIYTLSGANATNPSVIKRQGGQEALEKLASKQRVTAPTGGATTHDTPKDDPIAAALAD